MSTEANQAIIRRLVEDVWNGGNLAVVDELVAPTFVNHTPTPGDAPGREGVKQSVARVRHAFPDLHITIDDMLTDGDKVVTRWTIRGTHQAEFRGIPATHRFVTLVGVDIDRIVNGQTTEMWQYSDNASLLQQLGVFG